MFEANERPKLYIPTRVLEEDDVIIGWVREDSKNDVISANQIKALKDAGNHSIILKGFLGRVRPSLALKNNLSTGQSI